MPAMLQLLQRFSDFFGSDRPLFPDPHYAEAMLADLVDTQPFFVAEHVAGVVVGLIGGAIGPHPYNPRITVLTEMFWWVDAAHRGTRAGLHLLDAFCDYGAQHADWTVMTLEAKSPVNEACLTRRGFTLWERSYLRETPARPALQEVA